MAHKRVLLLSEAFGTGHTMAGIAIQEGAKLLKPEWEFRLIEPVASLSPHLSQWITQLYLKTLQYSPKLWGALYKRGQDRPMHRCHKFLLHRVLYGQIGQIVRTYQPDFIICTHPFPSAVISRLKRNGLKIPLYTVITDYGLHGAWISSGVDQYFVPSSQVQEQMIQFGIPTERIKVSGIPTNPKFWNKRDKRAARAKLGLVDQPTLLCMGGGLGLGLSEALLNTIKSYQNRLQILFVTGKNEALYRMLRDKDEFRHPNFHLYPFIDYVDELMDASDLLLSKPGGITCSEAISKSIPMILLEPIPGQEEDNMRYMLEHQYGIASAPSEQAQKILDALAENMLAEPFYYAPRPGNPNSGKKCIEKLINYVD